MKPFRVLVLGLAAAAVLGLAFWGRTAVLEYFRGLGTIFAGGTDPSFTYANFEQLRAENAGLRAELSNALNFAAATGTPAFGASRYHFVAAQVYSDYPFNDYSAITVAAGSRDGITPGMPVLAADGVLLGKVKTVSGTQSEVETIFDPAWRSAVAVGSNRVKALFVGGNAPGLDLVPKNSGIAASDTVWSVAADLPMNLLVGQVAAISGGPSDLWTTARIDVPWHPTTLDRVYIITNFPG